MEFKRSCRFINFIYFMYLFSVINRIIVIWGNYGKVSGSGVVSFVVAYSVLTFFFVFRVISWFCIWCGS